MEGEREGWGADLPCPPTIRPPCFTPTCSCKSDPTRYLRASLLPCFFLAVLNLNLSFNHYLFSSDKRFKKHQHQQVQLKKELFALVQERRLRTNQSRRLIFLPFLFFIFERWDKTENETQKRLSKEQRIEICCFTETVIYFLGIKRRQK